MKGKSKAKAKPRKSQGGATQTAKANAVSKVWGKHVEGDPITAAILTGYRCTTLHWPQRRRDYGKESTGTRDLQPSYISHQQTYKRIEEAEWEEYFHEARRWRAIRHLEGTAPRPYRQDPPTWKARLQSLWSQLHNCSHFYSSDADIMWGGIQGHAGAFGKEQEPSLQHSCSRTSANELIEGKSSSIHYCRYISHHLNNPETRKREWTWGRWSWSHGRWWTQVQEAAEVEGMLFHMRMPIAVSYRLSSHLKIQISVPLTFRTMITSSLFVRGVCATKNQVARATIALSTLTTDHILFLDMRISMFGEPLWCANVEVLFYTHILTQLRFFSSKVQWLWH